MNDFGKIIDDFLLSLWDSGGIAAGLICLWTFCCLLKGSVDSGRELLNDKQPSKLKSRTASGISLLICLTGLMLIERHPKTVQGYKSAEKLSSLIDSWQSGDRISVAVWLTNVDPRKWEMPVPDDENFEFNP